MFKAFARALRMAVAPDARGGGDRTVDQGNALAADDRGWTVIARAFAPASTSPSLIPDPMTDIAVVDYGMGNLRSVAKALATLRRSAASW